MPPSPAAFTVLLPVHVIQLPGNQGYLKLEMSINQAIKGAVTRETPTPYKMAASGSGQFSQIIQFPLSHRNESPNCLLRCAPAFSFHSLMLKSLNDTFVCLSSTLRFLRLLRAAQAQLTDFWLALKAAIDQNLMDLPLITSYGTEIGCPWRETSCFTGSTTPNNVLSR